MDRHAFTEGRRMDIKVHDAAVDKIGNRAIGNVLQSHGDLHHVGCRGYVMKIMDNTDDPVLIDDFRQGTCGSTRKAF